MRPLTSETEQTDEALVRAMCAGDVSAFEALYHRYRDWVVSLAYRFCRNEADALDVLQETFSYLLRKLPRFELRSRMKTFLYPAVKHLALGRKHAARRLAPLEGDVVQKGPPPSSSDVQAMIAKLPEEQRETVWLRFVDGLDLKEIADAMSVPVGTVKSRLHTALKTLREGRTS